ncbi:hypothetical protein WA026_020693 [Henosepilachna vigintioctopunctata]|uniref:Uncharacterized protein n=1 Tax=Henosepilachna vigintioctopunctata TaxID=420089 RepID=A0AAW1UBR6_9CUCU
MQALHHLTQLAGYNHDTTTSSTSKMGWLDGTPSRAISPSRGTEHSVLGPCESRHWPTIGDQSFVCILTDPGKYRVEVRLILGLERLYNRVCVVSQLQECLSTAQDYGGPEPLNIEAPARRTHDLILTLQSTQTTSRWGLFCPGACFRQAKITWAFAQALHHATHCSPASHEG